MEITENTTSISGEIKNKLEQYRQELLKAGLLEPTKRNSSGWHWLFHKPVTALTAFVVNLRGKDSCIEVTYGYASTAFTRISGDENALIEWGICDENITIREKIYICNEADEKTAYFQIKEMYNRYMFVEKDTLLEHVKIKRKDFIQKIAIRLKPLGFKKKANTWIRALESEYYVMFNVQKSNFSDAYYFNVYIGKHGTNDYGDCYDNRVAPKELYPTDWQVLSEEEYESFLDGTVVPILREMINTPLSELGNTPLIWHQCSCNRQKCVQCWVQKNRWESK